jgi:hypothetical protein
MRQFMYTYLAKLLDLNALCQFLFAEIKFAENCFSIIFTFLHQFFYLKLLILLDFWILLGKMKPVNNNNATNSTCN